jgi:hypothetical protein
MADSGATGSQTNRLMRPEPLNGGNGAAADLIVGGMFDKFIPCCEKGCAGGGEVFIVGAFGSGL